MKILVADDNRENITLLQDILQMLGHDIVQAFDGPSALESARHELPDLILLDVNMPGMNGFDVCAQIKSDSSMARSHVIMLTALSDVDSRVKGLAAGADDYLTKPFSPRELIARVDRSLRFKAEQDSLRDKQHIIRQTFERFVAAPVVEQLLQNPDQVKLGGHLQPVTVMYADLQGFTSLSEQLEPEELLQILNQYLAFIVDIALQYGGTIDKFMGDCVMVLYNTPITQADHVARAVKTALHIQDELYWFHQKLDEPYRLKVNFGIHTGMAVVGNIGAENLMDYTAVGDTVNVAARLQAVARGGQILVSRQVYQAVDEFVFGRSRGETQVKGRTEALELYEISNTLFD